MITTGEPFHQGSFGPVITTGEPSYPDSGRELKFTTPTPGTTSAAVATGALQPQPHSSPTPGFNVLQFLCHDCCCAPSHGVRIFLLLDQHTALPTALPRLPTTYKTKILIGELVIQPRCRHRCLAGVAAPPLRLRPAVATVKIQGEMGN